MCRAENLFLLSIFLETEDQRSFRQNMKVKKKIFRSVPFRIHSEYEERTITLVHVNNKSLIRFPFFQIYLNRVQACTKSRRKDIQSCSNVIWILP